MARNLTVASATFAALGMLSACGGDDKHPTTPPAPSASAEPAASASAAPVASASTSAAPAASASAAPATPPPPKATFGSASKNASSGKVDKVGSGDGAFKSDGVKDLVIDADYDGAASAFLLVSTDAQGMPNGEFTADTFVGTQALPAEVGANMNQGKFTAGLAVYEGDKLLNGKDGALGALAEGKHKLSFYVSSKDAPTSGSYKVIALLPDKSTVAGPVVAFGDAKDAKAPAGKTDAKPTGTKPAPAGSATKK